MQQMSLKKTIAQQEHALSLVSSNRQALETRVKMMRPASMDHDLLVERIRSVLGYQFDDEAVILSFPG